MATAAWRSSLRTASFRGVQFKVSSADREAGRRTVTHEFLGRDEPYVEDLGRKARTFSVEGYVLGPDYMPARDALLAACEEQGPGRLVLPWSDEVTVQLTACRVKESQAEGGMATFSLQFTEAGSAATPTGAPRMDALVDQQADDAMDAADEELDNSLDWRGAPSWIAENVVGNVQGIAGSIAEGVAGFVAPAGELFDYAQGVASDAMGLASGVASTLRPLYGLVTSVMQGNILQLATRFAGTVGLGSLVALGTSLASFRLSGLFSPLTSLFGFLSPRRRSSTPATAYVPATPQQVISPTSYRALAMANEQALARYHHAGMVTALCKTAATVIPPSQADATALRVAVNDSVDAVLDNTRSDAVYARFTDLRRTTVAAITANAGNAPQVTILQVPAPRPSLVLAHLAAPGQDPTRIEADMVTRNRIRHPGFPDCYPLEVITRG